MGRVKKQSQLNKAKLCQARGALQVSIAKNLPKVQTDEIVSLRSLNKEVIDRENALIEENTRLKVSLDEAKEEISKMKKLKSKYEESLEKSARKNACLLETRAELKEIEKKRGKLENRIRKMGEELDKKDVIIPPPNKIRCKYDENCSKAVKDSYCESVIESLEKLVGEGNLDSFTRYFIQYVANNDNFSFRLQLDDRKTAYCKVRFHWSDNFMKEFKGVCKKNLGFDVLSSRHKTEKLLKQADPNKNYKIELVETARKSAQNKPIQELTPLVTILNLKQRLESRLATLAENQRLHPGDLVIAIGGDKGGETTKLCLIIQNVSNPNNPQGILLLGMYYGQDNHQNLEKYFSEVFKQINELKEVEFDSPGGGKDKREVKIKIIGDCLFSSALLHHKGPTSSNPCYICEVKYSSHGSEKALVGNTDFHISGQLRTVASLSVDGRPLLNVAPHDFGIPPVHSIHGVTSKFGVDPLIAIANRLDMSGTELPVNLAEQKSYFNDLKTREETSLAICDDLNSGLRAINELEESYKKIQNKPLRMTKRKSPKCSSSTCVAHLCKNTKMFDKREFLQCSSCDNFFHYFCMNVVTSDEKLQLSNGLIRRKCVKCELNKDPEPTDNIRILTTFRSELIQKHSEAEIEYCCLNQERQELEAQLKKSSGYFRQKFESVLRQIGCDHRVWYQEMTGNQIRRLLRPENIKKVISIFPDSPELVQISIILNELAYLMTNSDNSEKSDALIDDIEKSIFRLTQAVKTVHKDLGVILKLHLITAHLVPHLRVHRSWGRVSEQGIESLHALINKLNRNFASVRNPTMKTALVLQSLINQNMLFDIGQAWKE